MSEQHRVADTARTYQVETVHVVCGNDVEPEASVALLCPDGEKRSTKQHGTGPVDAVCKAIDSIIQMDVELTEFSVNAVTEGIDALGDVTIRIEKEGNVYSGRGADTDIVVASAKAYVNAINRLLMIGAQDAGTESATPAETV